MVGVAKYSGSISDPVDRDKANLRYQQRKADEALARLLPVSLQNLSKPHRRALVIVARGGGVEWCSAGYWSFSDRMAKIKAPIFDDLVQLGLATPDGKATSLGVEKTAEILGKEDGYDLLRISKTACLKCGIAPKGGWAF